ncbi:MAG TPA: hypothetical protein VJ749_09750 [Pyrinomonadaceae bacterium]|jgi:hypothetical protein|nr:hypothetical protein [Pyrinomonadaceae bacterium]
MILLGRVALVLALTVSVIPAQSVDIPVTPEIFQVFDLPLTVTNPALVKTKHGYVLKCVLANASEFRQLGFRYSLAIVDADGTQSVLSRSEGFVLAPYQTKNVTFKTPLRLNLKGNERLVLMAEQVISADYVWDVVQPKDALASYLNGDYSTTPRVLRMLNEVDTREPLRILY